MMKQVINWTFGGFFRTIGRTLAFIVIGIAIAYIFTISDIKIPNIFRFALMQVNAAVLTENVKNKGTFYLRTAQTDWTNTDGFYETTVSSSSSEIVKTLTFDYDIGGSSHDYLQINFVANNPNATQINYTQTLNGLIEYCDKWQLTTQNGQQYYLCTRVSSGNLDITDREYIQNLLSGFNIMATINYSGGWSSCTFQDNAVFCPTNRSQVNSIDFHIMYNSNSSSSFKLGVHRSFTFYDYDTTGETIIQQQQETNNQINNTNTTQESNETATFFTTYQDNTPTALTAVVSAPLDIFNQLLTGVSSPLCFTLKSKQVCIPNGAMIWNKTTRTSFQIGNKVVTPHPFNSDTSLDVSPLVQLFNLVAGGFLCYKMLISLFRIVEENILNPTNSRVEVMKL